MVDQLESNDYSTSPEVSLIPASRVHSLWPLIEPHINRAVETTPDRYSTGDLFMDASTGKLGLWIVIIEDEIVASFMTKIYEVPLSKVCSVEWIGGDEMVDWVDNAINTIERYAKECGCNKIEGHGRMGWSKFVKNHGWKFLAISHEKDI